MAYTLNKWEKNGITRIYVNGLVGVSGSKIWLERKPVDQFGSDCDIRQKSDYNVHKTVLDNEVNRVDMWLREVAGKTIYSFDDILNAA